MSREIEKIFKQLMQYMEEHQDELDDGVDEKKLEYLSKALELEPDNLDGALALHKKYDEYEESQMLFPLAVLYYKKADFEASLQYLRRLAKANKDTKKFLRMMVNDSLEEYLDKMNPYGYQPFTIEELIYEHFEARYLFDSVDHFFDWAHRSLKKSSGSTKHSI